MSEQEKLSRLTELIASELREAPARPKLRLITSADLPPRPSEIYSDVEREWVRDRIRMWTRVYGLEQWVRQEMKGFFSLEEMPDEELQQLLSRVEHGVQCCRDGVGFDEAGLMG